MRCLASGPEGTGLLAPFYWYFTPYSVVHFTDGRKSTRPFVSGGLLLAKMFDPPAGLVGATTSVGVEYEIRRRKSLRFEIAHTRARHVSITWFRVGLAFR
jgi:hypothetical protein